jgi:3-phenylpropionate/trans-cinnamate dioxygenase ferredoxin reductase component
MNVNVWDVIDQIKPLIVSGTQIDTDRLPDTDVPYTAL